MFKILLSSVSISLFCVALATPFYSAQAEGGSDSSQQLNPQEHQGNMPPDKKNLPRPERPRPE